MIFVDCTDQYYLVNDNVFVLCCIIFVCGHTSALKNYLLTYMTRNSINKTSLGRIACTQCIDAAYCYRYRT